MKVSVVTVCFNAASTLAANFASVNAQDHDQIEHVVIDGGSTDGSQDLVRRCGRRVATFISEPDKGIYDAMNKGIAAASGDVIAFLNADDRYAHGSVVRHIVEHFESKRPHLLMGDVAYFHPQAPDRLVRRYRSDRFRPERIAWGWMPAHPALFTLREVFDAVGPFHTDYRIAADYEWVARVFSHGSWRYAHLPEVLVHMQTGGISTRGWHSTLLLNREVLRACRDNGIPTNWFKILSKYPAKLLEYTRP